MFFKKMSKTMLLTTLIWASGLYTSNLFAKDSFPLITYECDPAKDILLITNTLLKDGEEKTFKYSDEDGTYSPWDLVKIKDNNIIDSHSISKDCKLSSANYTVILEPQIFNSNLDGVCGATISATVSILSNGVEIQDRKALEFHCKGNTKIITGIKVIGKTGEIKIRAVPRYQYY